MANDEVILRLDNIEGDVSVMMKVLKQVIRDYNCRRARIFRNRDGELSAGEPDEELGFRIIADNPLWDLVKSCKRDSDKRELLSTFLE